MGMWLAVAAAGPPHLPANDDDCAADYWFASTRRCPELDETCCGDCPLEYYHVGSEVCLRRSDEFAFRSALTPGVPICVVAHGSFVDWADVRRDSYYTWRWLRRAAPERPLHVVIFTWPSEGHITLVPHLDVAILGRRAAWQGLHLARFIARLPPDNPVCVVGHSHGARVVAASLHLLGGGCVEGCRLDCGVDGRQRLRAVLAAAAIDHHWLNPGERYGRATWPVECLLNFRNRHDVALGAYPLRRPFSRAALARTGFTQDDVERLGWLSAKLAEADVTHLVGCGHIWPHYYSHPEIARAMVPYVYFPDADRTAER